MTPLEKYFNEKKIREAAEKAAISSASRIINKSFLDSSLVVNRLSNNYDPEINRVVDFRNLYLKNKDKLMRIKSICDNSDSELAAQINDVLGTII